MMAQLLAKPVIKNKYWIVEDQGTKIATIQAIEDGGFAYVEPDSRQRYATIKLLSKDRNIVFDNTTDKKAKIKESYNVHGYPVDQKPWNVLWDVKHQFPVYTKTSKSKSYFCAGHYLVKFGSSWVKEYCPKFITLNRYEFKGPFKTKAEAQGAIND